MRWVVFVLIVTGVLVALAFVPLAVMLGIIVWAGLQQIF